MTVQEFYDFPESAPVDDAPEMSFVFSTGPEKFRVSVVGDEDKPRGVQRIRIDAGPVAVFIQREDVPDLVTALLRALEAS